MMLDSIDWKLVSFISYTLFHEYIVHIRFPQIYYIEQAKQSALQEYDEK